MPDSVDAQRTSQDSSDSGLTPNESLTISLSAIVIAFAIHQFGWLATLGLLRFVVVPIVSFIGFRLVSSETQIIRFATYALITITCLATFLLPTLLFIEIYLGCLAAILALCGDRVPALKNATGSPRLLGGLGIVVVLMLSWMEWWRLLFAGVFIVLSLVFWGLAFIRCWMLLKPSEPASIPLTQSASPPLNKADHRKQLGALALFATSSWLLIPSSMPVTSGGNLAAQSDGNVPIVSKQPERILVIIVPGTYGNEGFWPNLVSDHATFGSEVQFALPIGSEVYPFLWASSVFAEAREQAARRLVEDIDRKAPNFDRICLVGHSHGGNVALMAAGRCRSKIDMVVCLSTPHPYLVTQAANGQTLTLPIYATPRTYENVKSIVTVVPNTDKVPEVWSNELLTGLTENDAIQRTREWREMTGHPRLHQDGFIARLFESGNIVALKKLLGATHNFEMHSLVSDAFGVKPHQCVHSRRMGTIIGRLFASGGQPQDIEYLRNVVQPEDADTGEPISNLEWSAKRHILSSHFHRAGWLLTRVDVELDRAAIPLCAETDQSLPDPRLSLNIGGRYRTYRVPASVPNTLKAAWEVNYFVYAGEKLHVSVEDEDVFGSQPLGTWMIQTQNSNYSPLGAVMADVKQGIYWAGTFAWRELHY